MPVISAPPSPRSRTRWFRNSCASPRQAGGSPAPHPHSRRSAGGLRLARYADQRFELNRSPRREHGRRHLSRLRERRLSGVFGRFQRLLVLGDHLIPAPPPFSSVGLELVGAMEKSDRSLPGRRDVRRYGFHGPPHLAMNFFTAPRIYSASPEPPIRPWSTRRRESRRADHFPFDSPTQQKVSARMDRRCLPEGCGTANGVREFILSLALGCHAA